MKFEAGDRVVNLVGRSGLVVATRIKDPDTHVFWDNGGRNWVSSLVLIREVVS